MLRPTLIPVHRLYKSNKPKTLKAQQSILDLSRDTSLARRGPLAPAYLSRPRTFQEQIESPEEPANLAKSLVRLSTGEVVRQRTSIEAFRRPVRTHSLNVRTALRHRLGYPKVKPLFHSLLARGPKSPRDGCQKAFHPQDLLVLPLDGQWLLILHEL